ncbi:hypothetical protein B296_00035235, partial [Ensete ventricosum]
MGEVTVGTGGRGSKAASLVHDDNVREDSGIALTLEKRLFFATQTFYAGKTRASLQGSRMVWRSTIPCHSRDPIQTSPDLDTLSSDSTDSLREQVRQVHQRLDEGVHQYIAVEALVAGNRDESKCPRAEQPRGHPSGPPNRREDRSDMLPSRPPPIPINSTRTKIFLQIRERELLKTRNLMKTCSKRRNKISAHGPEPAMPTQQTRRYIPSLLDRHEDFSLTDRLL